MKPTNHVKGFRFATLAIACQILSGCMTAEGEDAPLTIALRNSGTEPLRCQLIFGHWVERGLGEVAPGAATRIEVMRDHVDGGLYNMRPDGQKKMMVENVICGRRDDWQGTLGQIDLTPLRQRGKTTPAQVQASCAAPTGAGRVTCRIDAIEE
jgi:hypothetical protein